MSKFNELLENVYNNCSTENELHEGSNDPNVVSFFEKSSISKFMKYIATLNLSDKEFREYVTDQKNLDELFRLYKKSKYKI